MNISKEKLNEIIASHGKWLRSEEGGKRAYLRCANLRGADLSDADLRGADLSCADLSDADLSDANLSGANLSEADLSNANLSDADLSCADLSGADLSNAYLSGADLSNAYLSDANLSGANLSGANLSEADLDDYIVQVVRIGSRKGTTTYNATADNVLCGCWNNYTGGTLQEFKARVESIYGSTGKTPHEKYYAEYIAAIKFFEKVRGEEK